MSHEDVGSNDGVLEERLEFNEWVKHNFREIEIPSEHREHVTAIVSPEVRRSVRVALGGFGHPLFGKYLRMLRLGGATHAALEYAKHWRCLVCLAASRSKPMETRIRLRPFSTNKLVCVELTYLLYSD